MQQQNVILQPFTGGSPYLDDAVVTHMQVWPKDEEGTTRSYFSRYAGYEGFRGLLALVNEQVVGFGFGAHVHTGNWWYDRVAAQVGSDSPSLQHAWVLNELGVLEAYRSKGIGGILLEALLAHQPYTYALLSTEVTNTRARRLYEQHGWRYLVESMIFREGQEPFVVMQKKM
jgi:ribosomal protein S18 acetylase RimI-like enzyme